MQKISDWKLCVGGCGYDYAFIGSFRELAYYYPSKQHTSSRTNTYPGDLIFRLTIDSHHQSISEKQSTETKTPSFITIPIVCQWKTSPMTFAIQSMIQRASYHLTTQETSSL
jgi:hypothetical protein